MTQGNGHSDKALGRLEIGKKKQSRLGRAQWDQLAQEPAALLTCGGQCGPVDAFQLSSQLRIVLRSSSRLRACMLEQRIRNW